MPLARADPQIAQESVQRFSSRSVMSAEGELIKVGSKREHSRALCYLRDCVKLMIDKVAKHIACGLFAALTIAACNAPNSSAPAMLARSAAAAAVIERARAFHPAPPPSQLVGHNWPSAALVPPSDVQSVTISRATIRPQLAAAKPTVDVAYPVSANGHRTLALLSTNASLSIALQGANDTKAEYADGYLVYRNGLDGADIIYRPAANGFEDYFLFADRPAKAQIEYEVTLPSTVAGLRLISNVLELLDSQGTPLVHLAPPFLIDSAGAATMGVVSIAGCAVDGDERLPWGRPPLPPGANSCRVLIAWDDKALRYPALLDPNWTTAASMAVPRCFFGSEVLAHHVPELVVAFGGIDATYTPLATTEFFNADNNTWSPGHPMNVARMAAGSVSFNNSNGAANGDEVFVTGGYGSGGMQLASTEILSEDPDGLFPWMLAAPMQAGRAVHSATLIGTKVLVCGGQQFNVPAPLSACELYDTVGGTFASPAPPAMTQPRSNHSAVLLADGQSVLVTGGFGQSSNPPTAELFSGGQWLRVSDMLHPRENHDSILLADGRAMILGGSDAVGGWVNSADIFQYTSTPASGTFSDGGAFSTMGRWAPVALMANQALLFSSGFAGVGTQNGTETTEASLFDPKNNSWSTTSTSVAHDDGQEQSLLRSDGTAETIIFGGLTGKFIVHGVTDVFTLTPAGQPCGVGPECVTGYCISNVCTALVTVTIDATALTQSQLKLSPAGLSFPTSTPQTMTIFAGAYTLQPTQDGALSTVAFTITTAGTFSYDASLEGTLSGSGTSTLRVTPRPVTITASPGIASLALTNLLGGIVNLPRLRTGTLHLLPLAIGSNYALQIGASTQMQFDIDAFGDFQFDASFDNVAVGRGTPALLVRQH
jgi:hypothetical protein